MEVQWTIMLYLSGDNNLSPDMVRSINDIAASGIPKDVALAIQFDPSSPGLPTLRYVTPPRPGFRKNVDLLGPVPLESRAVAVKLGDNAASPNVLTDFIVQSLRELKEQHGVIGRRRLLVLSGHGSGAVGDFLTDQHVAKGQLKSLSIPRLRDALTEAKYQLTTGSPGPEFADNVPLFHVLGLDSCLMNMAEVCHEVRHPQLKGKVVSDNKLVNCLVASEGFVPRAGWPHGFLFQQLQKQTPETSGEMSRGIVRGFTDFYRTYIAADISVDIAACELRNLGAVVEALPQLTHVLREHLEDPVIKDLVILSHWRAQSFKFDQYTDLWDFCDLLNKGAKETAAVFDVQSEVLRATSVTTTKRDEHLLEKSVALVSSWQKTLATLNRIVEYSEKVKTAIEAVTRRDEDNPEQSTQESSGIDFQHAHGLSVYFPWQLPAIPAELSKHAVIRFPDLKEYKELRFAVESGWAGFLEQYLTQTMRPPRAIKGGTTVSNLIAGLPTQSGAPAVRFAGDDNRFAGDDNRFAGDDNRFLIQMFGGRMPWSMKNPPQQVEIKTTEEAVITSVQKSGG
jgi:hypothetical protein